MENEFKIGDKVVIKDRKPEWYKQPPSYTDGMKEYAGYICILSEFVNKKIVRLKPIDTISGVIQYSWNTDWLNKMDKIIELDDRDWEI